MKIQVTKDHLSSGLNAIARAVGKNATLPIIENVLLKAAKAGLELTATNLEMGVTTLLPASVSKEGSITIPANKLSGYIHNLPDDQLELILTGKNLKVKSASGEASFIGLPAKDFPAIPAVKGEFKIKLPAVAVAQMLKRSIGAVAQSEVRPEMAGVYWLFDNAQPEKPILKMVATDSYRLAESSYFLKNKLSLPGDDLHFILPKNAAGELDRLLALETKIVELWLDENQILFKLGETHLTSRLIEGNFPNYQAIIPESFVAQVTVPTQDFMVAVNRLSFFSSAKTQEVQLKLVPKQKQVVIKASSSETGVGETMLATLGKNQGEAVEFNLNFKYLADGLNWLKTEKTVMEAQDAAKPVVLRPVGQKDYLYLIMPLRG